MRQVLLIFGKPQAETAGDGLQAAGDRILVDVLGNIGGMDDLCQAHQARFLQVIPGNNGLERAATFVVTKFHAGGVKRDGFLLPDDLLDLAGRDEQEFGIIIDEAGDELGTGDSVHMNVRAGDP